MKRVKVSSAHIVEHALVYDYYQYSHIGRFACPSCGFGKITPYTYVSEIDYQNQTFTIDGVKYHSFMNTIYAIYNCAVVLTVMRLLGLDLQAANTVFKTFSMKEGRNEVFALSNAICIKSYQKSNWC